MPRDITFCPLGVDMLDLFRKDDSGEEEGDNTACKDFMA